MKISYSKKSERDWQRLYDFIAIHHPKAADNITVQLLQGIEYLKYFPALGRPVVTTSDEKQLGMRDLVIGNILFVILSSLKKFIFCEYSMVAQSTDHAFLGGAYYAARRMIFMRDSITPVDDIDYYIDYY